MMFFGKIFFWIIGTMFFVGSIGSALVVIFTTVDDVKDLRGREESETPMTSSVTQTGSGTHS
jgi:hypothetical protein